MHSSHATPELTHHDAEKAIVTEKVVEHTSSEDNVEPAENGQLKKSLKSRHMQMIAIGMYISPTLLRKYLTVYRWLHRCWSLRRFGFSAQDRWTRQSCPRFHDYWIHASVYHASAW